MVRRAEEIASDPKYGYSQKPPSGRWGPDYDCSSLMYAIADYAGYSVGTGKDSVRFTGTMLKDFEKAGFQILPFANVGISDLKIGDILLNLALHAEIYVGDGESVGALSSETGGYVGEAGDQTGHEIDKHPVATFDKEWDYVLRPPDDNDDDVEEEGEDEMPMNYTPNAMMPNQPWNMGYPQGGNPMPMQGYQQGYGMPQNRYMPTGYPQGNLGQMNGYSQANAGSPQQSMNPMPTQGYQQGNVAQNQLGFPLDFTYVHGIEEVSKLTNYPNSRVAYFDEDKPIMYATRFGPQGTPTEIRCFNLTEISEEMPQHLSPLMQPAQNGSMTGQDEYVTRAELEELKEMMKRESSAKQSNRNGSDGGRNGNQQSGPKFNARTN